MNAFIGDASTSTCYSPRLHAIIRSIGDGSCMRHILIAQYGHLWVFARFRFLLDLVSFPCCSTSQFSTRTRVVLPLDLVSLLHWTTCHIFIGPRVRFLFDHASQCCPSSCRIFIRPRGLTISFHVLDL